MLQAPIKVYAADDGKDNTGDDKENRGDSECAEEGPCDEEPTEAQLWITNCRESRRPLTSDTLKSKT